MILPTFGLVIGGFLWKSSLWSCSALPRHSGSVCPRTWCPLLPGPNSHRFGRFPRVFFFGKYIRSKVRISRGLSANGRRLAVPWLVDWEMTRQETFVDEAQTEAMAEQVPRLQLWQIDEDFALLPHGSGRRYGAWNALKKTNREWHLCFWHFEVAEFFGG